MHQRKLLDYLPHHLQADGWWHLVGGSLLATATPHPDPGLENAERLSTPFQCAQLVWSAGWPEVPPTL
jgi:hypothetical protein